MKKAWKVIGLAAAGMFILGLALVVVAAASGGGVTAVRERIGVSDFSRDLSDEHITSLEIGMSVGSLTITPGAESFRIEARDVAQSGFVCEVIGGVLTIRDEWESSWALDVSRGFNISNYQPSVHIYLPVGFEAETAELAVDAGVLRVEGLTAEKAELSVNAGEITVIDITADEIELSCDAGAARLSGRVLERGSFTCAVGKVELELDGLLRDYDISGSVSLGRLAIGGDNWNMSGNISAGTDGGIPLKLEVDVGEMTLRFNG